MTAREPRPLPDTSLQRHIRILADSADLPSREPAVGIDLNIDTINAPAARTLSPISSHAMNTLNGTNPSTQNHTPSYNPSFSKAANGTIRSVPLDTLHIDATTTTASSPPDEAARRAQSKIDQPAMPHSTKTLPQAPIPIPIATPQPALARQNSNNLVVGNGLIRKLSAEFGPTRTIPNISTSTNSNSSPNSNHPLALSEDTNGNTSAGPGGPTQWSSAVGRANLGKSGRVIERLMGENDMLKRDLNLERLRAEESRQAVKMAEGKMEALTAEYDGKLHDAAINKTLLKRRERQLSDLKAQIEGERQRADSAVEREKTWRIELEKVQEECKRKVEEAQTFAALMEGRNKALTSHWKDQGVEVDRTVTKLSKEIESIVEERRNDDRKMNMLQGLCDQQAELLGSLEREKQGIQMAFERYKKEQEESLQGIKERAQQQEAANEATLRESQKVLGELKWALAVKKNVKGAQ
ncbi:hypothetical protein L207DRAFT_330476 [Hyaloscypha variabilis F]|uniref:SWI5-dependent HO expression protein 3 n=1 Tax=Hyaloscypha variabilis (strain UAMH 11265 / GT02V1 / F) TaxID=1149755 RepID=A0A2J6RT36_HYAVF|nr:hypothetical protein L207DRAFT_330476 [Hyaloscypha variabilis F]